MKLFGRPFGLWLILAIGLIVTIAIAYVLHLRYWQYNYRLLTSTWNLYRALRTNGALNPSNCNNNEQNSDESQAAFFQSFCNEWATDPSRPIKGSLLPSEHQASDVELLNRVDRVPIEYSVYANVSAKQLREHWGKFVTNRCSSYYDKLICQNGLVFDWRREQIYTTQTAYRDEKASAETTGASEKAEA